MNSKEGKKFDYSAYISAVDPKELALVLPRWQVEERTFVRHFKGSKLLEEQKGWELFPPYNYGGFIQIEKDARRVTVRKGMNRIEMGGVRKVGTKLSPNMSLIVFSRVSQELSIWVPHEDRRIEVSLSSGRRNSNIASVYLEIVPTWGMVIGPQTTLGELSNYF